MVLRVRGVAAVAVLKRCSVATASRNPSEAAAFHSQESSRTRWTSPSWGTARGETVIFSMRNMNNQGKLYKMGLKPVYRVLPNVEKEWQRVPNNVQYDYIEDCGPFMITFSHNFAYDESETTYFAFTYPFSFEEIQN
jgi:hypothetical protein